MTYETYENLMRVLEKRLRQGVIAGDWKDVSVVCAEKQQLRTEFFKDQQARPETGHKNDWC